MCRWLQGLTAKHLNVVARKIFELTGGVKSFLESGIHEQVADATEQRRALLVIDSFDSRRFANVREWIVRFTPPRRAVSSEN